MKVSVLCFMAVMSACLSTGDSMEAVDNVDNAVDRWDATQKARLTTTVNFFLTSIGVDPSGGTTANQFSFVSTIPENQNLNNLGQFFEADHLGTLMKTIFKPQSTRLYTGTHLVAAAPYQNVHAERRVLKNMAGLAKIATDTLVFYSYFSPCEQCTTHAERNILDLFVSAGITDWTQRALVFTRVYDKTAKGVVVPVTVITNALNQLGNSVFGHENIFRCHGPTGAVQCIRCFDNNRVVQNQCVAN